MCYAAATVRCYCCRFFFLNVQAFRYKFVRLTQTLELGTYGKSINTKWKSILKCNLIDNVIGMLPEKWFVRLTWDRTKLKWRLYSSNSHKSIVSFYCLMCAHRTTTGDNGSRARFITASSQFIKEFFFFFVFDEPKNYLQQNWKIHFFFFDDTSSITRWCFSLQC